MSKRLDTSKTKVKDAGVARKVTPGKGQWLTLGTAMAGSGGAGGP
jgi:hypothetical protein